MMDLFSGVTYSEPRDGQRLRTLLHRVLEALSDGEWHTLRELAERCGGSEASCSARIRDIRSPKKLNIPVEAEFVHRGLWRYRRTL